MTVNELIQKLVELARDGKGQWQMAVQEYSYSDIDIVYSDLRAIGDIRLSPKTNEVVID
jgi:hypothetical protein